MELSYGSLRKLTSEEISMFSTAYKYVTTSPSRCRYDDKEIIVPVGFLTDGCSGGPDFGRSWLFHDWLYATHKFSSGQLCSRKEADEVMENILNHENQDTYQALFTSVSDMDPISLFSEAWESSWERGPEFLPPVEEPYLWRPITKSVAAIRRSISLPVRTNIESNEKAKLRIEKWTLSCTKLFIIIILIQFLFIIYTFYG